MRENMGKLLGDNQGYPLVNSHIAIENHHAIYGKIHYNWPFSIAMLNYQRVAGKTRDVRVPLCYQGWCSLWWILNRSSLRGIWVVFLSSKRSSPTGKNKQYIYIYIL